MSNPCEQSDRIRNMEIDLAVAKSDINNVKNDINDIKSDIKSIDGKFDKVFWFTLSTGIGVIVQIIFLFLPKK